MALAIGLDIGGTKCAVSIGREEADGLTILDKRMMKTRMSCSRSCSTPPAGCSQRTGTR